MCLALPYRIEKLLAPGRALGRGPEGVRVLDVSQIGEPAQGAYVLVAYGSAVRELEPDDAAEILAVWESLRAAEGL